ncbi:EamA family transporter RarD [Fontivita pretiosa]|uniref:EamA family transporter RarD n=1 Tax=Fontivita pretiosa TaxID=2989684 RepID=UPI003D16E339
MASRRSGGAQLTTMNRVPDLRNVAAAAASAAHAPAAARAHAAPRIGLACGLGAYLLWGFIALYFKLVAHVPPIHVLAHRVVWSLVFVVALTAITGGWNELHSAIRNRRTLLFLAGSTTLLSINWFTFILAVATDRVVQASLGYFINPLVNVLLGMIFLRERLRPWQVVGLLLASSGVATLALSRGYLPWIALALAVSFGFYGLLRKLAPVGAMPGLTVETAILFVPALATIFLYQPANAPAIDPKSLALLMLAGVVTAVPLLLFTAAARRLRLATMGFLQYLAPSCQFLLAIFAFHEPFSGADLTSFCLIWTALLIYSLDSYMSWREGMIRLPSAPPEP